MQQALGSALSISRHADIGDTARWRKKDILSQKSGPHATVYLINGDRYIGDWESNQRHGKGIHFFRKNGFTYEGEFKNDMRSGYGTLSIPITEVKNSVAGPDSLFGGSKPKQAEAEATVPLRKVYTGSWLLDKRHGSGTYFYPDGSMYHGCWANDMKEGWGRMKYANGNVYEGEFHAEKRHGTGVLLLGNGDRYEGMWYDDLKEGPGKYVYLKKRQCMEGELAVLDADKILENQRLLIYEERTARLMGGVDKVV